MAVSNYYTINFSSKEALDNFRLKCLNWLHDFDYAANFDTNFTTQYKDSSYNWLLAAGAKSKALLDNLEQLEDFFEKGSSANNWFFLALAYELKNTIFPNKIHSRHENFHELPNILIFEPLYVFYTLKEQPLELYIYSYNEAQAPYSLFQKIEKFEPLNSQNLSIPKPIVVQERCCKTDYLNKIESIQKHIIDGNVYELNFCQEFFVENINIDNTALLYHQLNSLAQTPFAVYFKAKQWHLCSASPERYMQYKDEVLCSQPIKGTAPRHAEKSIDNQLAYDLQHSIKDRAENLMIVDLVRNDLSKICNIGSVKVEELCALYGFPNVWQLVSTIKGKKAKIANKYQNIIEVLQATFPMGSMTGAPKIAAMQYIDEYENNCRAWYSGSIGYIAPNGDFDFNVVIRSLFYNTAKKYLSWQVGGAIVYDSIGQSEYEECETKMSVIKKILDLKN